MRPAHWTHPVPYPCAPQICVIIQLHAAVQATSRTPHESQNWEEAGYFTYPQICASEVYEAMTDTYPSYRASKRCQNQVNDRHEKGWKSQEGMEPSDVLARANIP